MRRLTDKVAAQARAVQLIQMGFRTKIVHLETGVHPRALRRFYREHFGRTAPPGMLPEVERITSNRATTEEATLLLVIYQRLHPDADRKLDVDKLCTAYRFYMNLRPEACGKALDINEAWVLARDLKAGRLKLAACGCRRGRPMLHGSAMVLGCDAFCEKAPPRSTERTMSRPLGSPENSTPATPGR